MRKILIGAFCGLVLPFLVTCSQPPKQTETIHKPIVIQPTLLLDPETQEEYEEVEIPLRQKEPELTEKQIKINQMALEIENFWYYWYEKRKWPVETKIVWTSPEGKAYNRAELFDYLSILLAKQVWFYQNNSVDIGGKLPLDKNTHLFFAMMVAKETVTQPDVVGNRGEVGLIQTHGTGPLMLPRNTSKKKIKERKKEVMKDPELSLKLGVRWMTHMIYQCRVKINKWNDHKWAKPLTLYAAGGKVGRENGKCREIKIAKQRIWIMKKYRRLNPAI